MEKAMDCEKQGRKHLQWIGAAIGLLSVASLMVNGVSILSTDGGRISLNLPGGLVGIALGWRLWAGGPRAANWTQRITAFLAGFSGLALLVLAMRLPWHAGLSSLAGMETVNAPIWGGLAAVFALSAVSVVLLRGMPVRDYLETRGFVPARTFPSASIGSALALCLLLLLYNAAYKEQWNIGHQILEKNLSPELDYHVMSFQTRSNGNEVTFAAAVGAYDRNGYCVGQFSWTGTKVRAGSYQLRDTSFHPVKGHCDTLMGHQ
jgi:hypothetical protein